ncbi:helix-turn-helix transcriptional regulator [Pseudomonas citronellolis]|uniref:helix-turn-helix transcriptional regulator n=1 Tax=Pseudomonas citronellolis TaxID=53408 RepID=UPI0023E35F7F|nr:WYL domain-containing protein [Pseudomonas citronellolis]MDF3935608.1 WYL domain-containing protein [Pseudomonas citronellolis]
MGQEKQSRTANTLIRRDRVRALVGEAGKAGISAAELTQRLFDEDFDVVLRTVQRDLELLTGMHELSRFQREGQARWRTSGKGRLGVAAAPTLKPDAAALKSARLALGIVTLYEQASHLLHFAALDDLREQYLQARQLLDKFLRHEGRWLGKVVVGTQHLQLRRAAIDQRWLRELQMALLGGYQVELRYYSRSQDQEQSYVVHPLGLSYRDSSIYLVCTIDTSEKVRSLPLQRILAVRALESRQAREPEGFDLRQHQHILVEPDPIALKLRISPSMRFRLDDKETPLAEQQRFTELADGRWLLECQVPYSQGLLWWILGHGATVEVLEPPSLRRQVAECVAEVAAFYRETPATEAVA